MPDETTQTTQQFRDVLQQSDHDSIVELKVMITTILGEIRTLKDDVKGNQATQAQALASFSAKTEEVQRGQESRIRKLEDLALQNAGIITDIMNLKNDVQSLKDSKNEVLGGARVIWGLIILLGWLIALTASIVFHLPW